MTSMLAEGRQWLPADWLDEVNPTLLDSPDAFIERVGDGWGLRLPVGDSERDNTFYQTAIEPGQIVNFLWTEHYGDRTLTMNADRTWSLDEPAPAGATHFYEYTQGMLSDSVDSLVNGDAPDCGVTDPLDPGEYVISTYTWSDSIPFLFDIDDGGNGRFILCPMAH